MEKKLNAIVLFSLDEDNQNYYIVGSGDIQDVYTFSEILRGNINSIQFTPETRVGFQSGILIIDKSCKYFISQRENILSINIITNNIDLIKFNNNNSSIDIKNIIDSLDKKRMIELINY